MLHQPVNQERHIMQLQLVMQAQQGMLLQQQSQGHLTIQALPTIPPQQVMQGHPAMPPVQANQAHLLKQHLLVIQGQPNLLYWPQVPEIPERLIWHLLRPILVHQAIPVHRQLLERLIIRVQHIMQLLLGNLGQLAMQHQLVTLYLLK